MHTFGNRILRETRLWVCGTRDEMFRARGYLTVKMKRNVICGAPVVMTAVSAAAAGDPGKDASDGSTKIRKVPTVNYMVASPRTYEDIGN
jgi:hypothetical protein